MKRWLARAWMAGLAAAMIVAGWGCAPKESALAAGGDGEWLAAERGEVRPWVPVAGVAVPRRVERIASRLQGAGVLVELAEEGRRVVPGEVVARFETSELEQDLARQEGEVERTRQELASLEGAELPLEVLELEAQVQAAEGEVAGEEQFLEASEGLAARGLMGEGEVDRQKGRVEDAKARLERIRKRLELTQASLHPARLGKARAALAAAEAARDFTQGQLALCEVRAEGGGVVSLVPLPMGGEMRVAEVGDTVFRNQVFMALPDVGAMVVEAWVEERDWRRVAEGSRALVTATDCGSCAGTVESVGRIGRGGMYPVRIGLDVAGDGAEAALDWPAGMSVTARVFGEAAEDVVRVRRGHVKWDGGADGAVAGQGAWVWVQGEDGKPARRAIELGAVDGVWAEVKSGLSEGEAYR